MLLNHRSLLSYYAYRGYSSPSVDSILLAQFLVIDSKKLSFLCIKLQLDLMYFFQLTNGLRFWCIYYTLWSNFITGLCIRLIHDRSCHYQNETCSFSSISIVFLYILVYRKLSCFYSNHGHGFSNQKISHTATAFSWNLFVFW